MPVSLAQLTELLEENSDTAIVTARAGKILFALSNPSGPDVPCLASVDDVAMQIRTVDYVSVVNPVHRGKVLRLAAELNYQYKIVKLAYNADLQEIAAYIDFPVEGARLTSAQFARCVEAMQGVALRARKRLAQLADTGTDPGEDRAGDRQRELLVTLMLDAMRERAAAASGERGAGVEAAGRQAPPGRSGLPARPNRDAAKAEAKDDGSSGFDRFLDDELERQGGDES